MSERDCCRLSGRRRRWWGRKREGRMDEGGESRDFLPHLQLHFGLFLPPSLHSGITMSSYSLSSSPANEDPPETRKFTYSQPGATTTSIGSAIPFHHLKHLNQSMVSGAGAGLISSVVTCPLDVLKTRLQAQEIGRGKVGYEGVLGTSSSSSPPSSLLLSFASLALGSLRLVLGLFSRGTRWSSTSFSIREAQLEGWRAQAAPTDVRQV